MSRAQLTSTVEQNTGGAVAPLVAGKNFVVGGGFDIWQRGTSFASTSGYFADRWTNLGDFSGVTASQQTSGAPIGSRYFLRLTSTAGSSYWSSYQFLETSVCAPLWGNTVTMSVKLRRNSTLTNGVNFFIQKSATVDAGSGATWTTISTFTAANASMPTGTTSSDWYSLSGSLSIPNDGTANSLRIIINYTAATASGSVLDISNVQLEVGSVATPFSRAGGTLQGELALAQRYYYRANATGAYSWFAAGGIASSTTLVDIPIALPVTMRVAPTSIDSSNIGITDNIGSVITGTLTLTAVTTSQNVANVRLTTTGLTQYRTYAILANNSSSAYLGFNSEL